MIVTKKIVYIILMNNRTIFIRIIIYFVYQAWVSIRTVLIATV